MVELEVQATCLAFKAVFSLDYPLHPTNNITSGFPKNTQILKLLIPSLMSQVPATFHPLGPWVAYWLYTGHFLCPGNSFPPLFQQAAVGANHPPKVLSIG